MKRFTAIAIGFAALVGASKGYSQTNDNPAQFHSAKVVLTGILIVSDWRCEEHRAEGDLSDFLQMVCTEGRSDWGLVTGRNLYALQGNAATFKKNERCRITITGLATGQTIVVDSILPTSVTDREIVSLVEELRTHQWTGPENHTIPMHWILNFTDPMLKILQAGPSAQNILMQYLGDREIRDQIIILLGGVGDETVVEAIIQAMPTPAETYLAANKKMTNLIANIALTNITVSGVIWHHGGGISFDACPRDPKSCWNAWWTQNRDTFRVSAGTHDRRYSNYPDYGIYQQP